MLQVRWNLKPSNAKDKKTLAAAFNPIKERFKAHRDFDLHATEVVPEAIHLAKRAARSEGSSSSLRVRDPPPFYSHLDLECKRLVWQGTSTVSVSSSPLSAPTSPSPTTEFVAEEGVPLHALLKVHDIDAATAPSDNSSFSESYIYDIAVCDTLSYVRQREANMRSPHRRVYGWPPRFPAAAVVIKVPSRLNSADRRVVRISARQPAALSACFPADDESGSDGPSLFVLTSADALALSEHDIDTLCKLSANTARDDDDALCELSDSVADTIEAEVFAGG